MKTAIKLFFVYLTPILMVLIAVQAGWWLEQNYNLGSSIALNEFIKELRVIIPAVGFGSSIGSFLAYNLFN